MDKKAKLLVAGIILLLIAVLVVLQRTLPPEVFCLVGVFFALNLLIFLLLIVTRSFRNPASCNQINSNTMGHAGTIPYSDKLISIDEEGITIRLFYFPFGSKKVKFSDIEVVQAFKGGCPRCWGSGDFRTWFGLDWGRMDRPMMFIIKQKNKWSRVGFTCEDSESVAQILQSKNLLQSQTSW